MSFNNLAFNITKATPTTSTTSNTVSTASTTATDSKEVPKQPDSKSNSAKSQLLQGMLSSSQSPQLSSVCETAPAVVTYGDDSSRGSTPAGSGNPTKTDLIGLFDKFAVTDRKKEQDFDDKFERFKPLNISGQKDEYTEKATNEDALNPVKEEILTSSTQEDEDGGIIEEKHLTSSSPQDTIVQTSGPIHKDLIDMDEEGSQGTTNGQNLPVENLESASEQPDKSQSPIEPGNFDEIDADQASAEEHYQLTEEEINMHKTDIPQRPDAWGKNRSISQVNINPAAQYQQSHKPFDFHVFLSQLKMKSADPVARYIKSFLVSFNRQAGGLSLQQKSKVVKDFKIFMNEKFSLYEPFASMDEISLENAREGLEKLVMNRIYSYCFPPEILASHFPIEGLVKSDLEDDTLFDQQLEKFSWVNGTHLEVNIDQFITFKAHRNGEEYCFMENAVKEFNKINNYRAPRDKVICLLEGCKNIFWYLKANKKETNADEFIPILIFVIINAKVNHLISNIHYIENFRGSEWLNRGETSYYISSIEGAISFIQNLGLDDLTISPEEYEAHMEAWAANDRIRREQQETETIPILSHPQQSQANAGMSPSSVLMTSAEMFAKSIGNLLSPSPPPDSPNPTTTNQQSSDAQATNESPSQPDPQLLKSTLESLKEIFPDLDRSIMKDIVYMNNGDVDKSLDACLQLVNDT